MVKDTTFKGTDEPRVQHNTLRLRRILNLVASREDSIETSNQSFNISIVSVLLMYLSVNCWLQPPSKPKAEKGGTYLFIASSTEY
jgi:hypothetical protein